jgi:hypothetical protein
MQVGDIIVFDRFEWRVLDMKDGMAFIVTERIVELRPFHSKYKDTTWHNCETRSYLNGAFFDGFEESNKAKILETTIQNPDNPWYGTSAGGDSKDRIFLLDLEEACKYFGDSTDKLHNRGNNRYWKKNDPNNAKRLALAPIGNGCWWWWLRSPGRHNRLAAYVHGTDGCVGVNGNNVTNSLGGIRPALWLKLD